MLHYVSNPKEGKPEHCFEAMVALSITTTLLGTRSSAQRSKAQKELMMTSFNSLTITMILSLFMTKKFRMMMAKTSS